MIPPIMGALATSVMSPMMGGATYHCKPTSNIDIYPSTLVFVENIGHKYDFQWGRGSLVGSGVGGTVVQIQRKRILTEY